MSATDVNCPVCAAGPMQPAEHLFETFRCPTHGHFYNDEDLGLLNLNNEVPA